MKNFLLKKTVIILTTTLLSTMALANEAEDPVYQWYASTYKTSIKVAKDRLALMDYANLISGNLEKEDPDYVDMYIENEPNFRVVFNYQEKDGLVDTRKLKEIIKDSPLEKYAFVKTVKRSQSDLKSVDKILNDTIKENNIDKFKVYIDPKTNNVVADVPQSDSQILVSGLNQKMMQMPNSAMQRSANPSGFMTDGVTIGNLKKVPNFQSWGGGKLTSNTSLCTSGFSVKDTKGILGLSTAQHCSTPYWGSVSSTNLMTLKKQTINRDVAWYATPSNLKPENKIVEKSGVFRKITGTTTLKVGSVVCKYGITTGYNCGTVTKTGVTTSVGPDGGPYTTVGNLVEVTKNGKPAGGALTKPGDSGGPWWSSNNAVGTSVAGVDTESYYAPVSSITAMGVSILTQ